MSSKSDKSKKVPIKIVITDSFNKDTHLFSLIVEPESNRSFQLTHGKIEGLRLNKATRGLPGHILLDATGDLSMEFEVTPTAKVGKRTNQNQLAAVLLFDLWRKKFSEFKEEMIIAKQAEMWGYEEPSALYKRIREANKFNFSPMDTFIALPDFHRKSGIAMLIRKSGMHIDEHAGVIKIKGEGWVWKFGDKEAEYGLWLVTTE